MSDNVERAIGRLEGKMDVLQKDVSSVKEDVKKLSGESHRRKGGWRVILGASTAAGVIGGLAAKIWPFS